jgi:hypothetical protein
MTQIVCPGGGGFLYYYVGFYSVLQHLFDHDKCLFSGISAGTLPSLALAGNVDMNIIIRNLLSVADNLQHGFYNKVYDSIRGYLEEILTDDVVSKCNDRLHIGITQVPYFKHVTINNWTSVDDLIDCVIASCFIPIVLTSSLSKSYRDGSYIDGTFTKRVPVLPVDRPALEIHKFKWKNNEFRFMLPNKDRQTCLDLVHEGINHAYENLSEINTYLPFKAKIYKSILDHQQQDKSNTEDGQVIGITISSST